MDVNVEANGRVAHINSPPTFVLPPRPNHLNRQTINLPHHPRSTNSPRIATIKMPGSNNQEGLVADPPKGRWYKVRMPIVPFRRGN